ncbi:MerR family transcriptional regulator [Taibaiella sp. KBW10]|uniref:chaperone modulator CbpM n=1 Tax=Taibaiella sp. KBW10 TaxID=2153357 RepID=UPI000F596A22|nr:chaperone modulator CbpM [Taibaiella sp. KBW10]RQO31359.1 MerR family transcriptional regulator [Taibaiella sp. KBW10]
MQKEQLILVRHFCHVHHLEVSFISDLQQYELFPLIVIEEELYIEPEQLPLIERIVRLRTDLGINPEGIEAISHLLSRMEEMNHQIASLQHRLKQYE